MKIMFILGCLLAVTALCLQLCSASPSNFSSREYLLKLEQTMKSRSFTVGKFWSDCSKPGDHGKIIDVTLSPDPPQRGSDFVVNTTITVDEDVTGGKVNIFITGGLFPIQKVYDICKILSKMNLSCPIKHGIFNFEMKMNIPTSVPADDYGGTMITSDQNHQRIFCVNFKIHLVQD